MKKESKKIERFRIRNSLIFGVSVLTIAFFSVFVWSKNNNKTKDMNSGDWNSGNRNSGDWNSGDWNSGDWNIGNGNSGNGNSGDWNIGYENSGNGNSGNGNSGDWNIGNGNSGYFNTSTPKVRLFNKDTNINFNDKRLRDIRFLNVSTITEWVPTNKMTNREKLDNPSYKITDGYLKNSGKINWSNLTEKNKAFIKSLPNFDDAIFKEITGISLSDYIEVTVNGVVKVISKTKAKKLGLIE